MPARGKENGKYQGSKWCRREKRLAWYLRDSLACVYCGSGVEDGVMLTLDHLIPWSACGTNEVENIVSCCSRCNSSRGNRDWKVFVKAVAQYLNHGVTAKQIIIHIEETRRRPLDVAAAKEMIAHRGSFAAVLQGIREKKERNL